ncbi:sulfatase [Bordetella pertussis]|uniref:Arylsulfatase n=2 Tax=Bordetella pertussis TaxID=520 RepID=A0A0E7V0K5_BORPT|nr:sulfatase-like hydrolase/transferase [Bordetella pertussis]ETA65556.1 type I phosphodiesterase/nucleotide pyrophosphatase [Bordetella pertussis CHLA-11]ETG99322.1 type I phosphodiesterase/nucleotide pyrophosphatase [Bordetella pertussis 2250905]ETH05321.1 type I phosphodiesterase/nucleotide pyrophosphatase [Bordetella pertussis 2356847]ETH06376.1 type I phosphodiesterase/nucleotide pyrophosphatase [Bordetella pertussis 2371640]ETH13816.1 type I phosphodiesterase/nucleotide pyrophosphatase [
MSQVTQHPNVVLILADNLGWGELGCYGGGAIRGAPTPRIDALAAQGTQFLNFNVESDCVPTRSALMTGRHPVRTGAMQSVPAGLPQGLVPWERTLAQAFSEQGYATAMYGKWHLGDKEGRYPKDRGFDEWYGIPRTTNESMFMEAVGFDPDVVEVPYVMEGRKGSPAERRERYDLEMRRRIDEVLTQRSCEFIGRHAGKAPFFLYVPLTQLHFPTIPHREFEGRTGKGDFADSLVEMDARIGQILDAVDQHGIADDTVFIFASDNGPEYRRPWRGSAGMWTGTYHTAMEGALRVPLIVRWPGKVPAGRPTRSCTWWTCSPRWPASPACRCRKTGPSTASTSPPSCWAARRNRRARALSTTSRTSCARPNGATGKCTSSGRWSPMSGPTTWRRLMCST